MRTVVDSVVQVDARTRDADEIERELDALRALHPGVIVQRYLGHRPRVGEGVYLAPGAAIVGDVRLADRVSVWFGCVLRADVSHIEVGVGSNLQDGTVVHLGDNDPTIVGQDVVVGHRAVLHGCTVEDGCLVGIGATLLDGSRVGHGSLIGSGALVTPGAVIPPRSLVLGSPAKVVRTLTAEDEEFYRALAGKYRRLAHNHAHG